MAEDRELEQDTIDFSSKELETRLAAYFEGEGKDRKFNSALLSLDIAAMAKISGADIGAFLKRVYRDYQEVRIFEEH